MEFDESLSIVSLVLMLQADGVAELVHHCLHGTSFGTFDVLGIQVAEVEAVTTRSLRAVVVAGTGAVCRAIGAMVPGLVVVLCHVRDDESIWTNV